MSTRCSFHKWRRIILIRAPRFSKQIGHQDHDMDLLIILHNLVFHDLREVGAERSIHLILVYLASKNWRYGWCTWLKPNLWIHGSVCRWCIHPFKNYSFLVDLVHVHALCVRMLTVCAPMLEVFLMISDTSQKLTEALTLRSPWSFQQKRYVHARFRGPKSAKNGSYTCMHTMQLMRFQKTD